MLSLRLNRLFGLGSWFFRWRNSRITFVRVTTRTETNTDFSDLAMDTSFGQYFWCIYQHDRVLVNASFLMSQWLHKINFVGNCVIRFLWGARATNTPLTILMPFKLFGGRAHFLLHLERGLGDSLCMSCSCCFYSLRWFNTIMYSSSEVTHF